MARSADEHKQPSIKEFTKAAEINETKAAGLGVLTMEAQKGFRAHLVARK